MRHGSAIGEHRVTFRPDGNRLIVETRVQIAVKVLFFTAFRFAHEAEEVWRSDRLVSVTSTTDDNGTTRQVSGHAVAGGFRITGEDGPFDAFRRLHPAFEALSVVDMVHVSGPAPVHAGAMRYYRERGWLR
jgi:hypothetical protein